MTKHHHLLTRRHHVQLTRHLTGLYRWTCSCGLTSYQYTNPHDADQAAENHADACRGAYTPLRNRHQGGGL